MAAMLRRLPASSAYARDTLGDAALWTLESHLLAVVVDALATANWQRGGKGPRPRPVPRPGVKQPGIRYGGTPIDQDKARAYLDRLKPPPLPDREEVSDGH